MNERARRGPSRRTVPLRTGDWVLSTAGTAPRTMPASRIVGSHKLLQEAKTLRQMAAAIRVSAGATQDECERPRSARSSKRSPVARRSPSRAASSHPRASRSAMGEPMPVRLEVGVLALEVASAEDATVQVALVSRSDPVLEPCCEPRWRQCASPGGWLVLEQAVDGPDVALLVEVWSSPTDDSATTRGRFESLGQRLGSLLVDCTAVCRGHDAIDGWFQATDGQGTTAAQMLLVVERHAPAATSRKVASLPLGWDRIPAVDMADRVSEVAQRIQRRKKHSTERRVCSAVAITDRRKQIRQTQQRETVFPKSQVQGLATSVNVDHVTSDSALRRHQTTQQHQVPPRQLCRSSVCCAAAKSATTATASCAESPVDRVTDRENEQECHQRGTVGAKRSCVHVLQDKPSRHEPLKAFDENGRPLDKRRPTAATGPLKLQRPVRDTVKRVSNSHSASAATFDVPATTPSTTPRRRRKREFEFLNTLL